MRSSFILAAAVMLAPTAAMASKRPVLGSETVTLNVVGYRTDGIDTSHTGAGQIETVKATDIRRISHPSSWYYAVEMGGLAGKRTLLASEISVAVGSKVAKFTSADANPPEGSADSLLNAARRQVSPQPSAHKVAARGRRHR
jgi:hypothetical protein